MIKTLSILGAGKVGIVLAQLALKAGYAVYVAGSGDVAKIALTVKILAPGAHAVTKEEAAKLGDVIILALPLSKYKSIPKDELKGKLVIDAMNHWYEVDGAREDTIPDNISSSEAVQAYLADSRVIKALSHMGYHELYDNPKALGEEDRKAIAIAGDNENDIQIVADFINTLGFDPLLIGELKNGQKLEPGQPGFGTSLNIEKLREVLKV